MKYIKFLWLFLMCCHSLPGMSRFANMCTHFKNHFKTASWVNPMMRLSAHKNSYFPRRLVLGGSTAVLAQSENDKLPKDNLSKDNDKNAKIKLAPITIIPDEPHPVTKPLLGGICGGAGGFLGGALLQSTFPKDQDALLLGGCIIGGIIGTAMGRSAYLGDKKKWNEFLEKEKEEELFKQQQNSVANSSMSSDHSLPKLEPITIILDKPWHPVSQTAAGAGIGFLWGALPIGSALTNPKLNQQDVKDLGGKIIIGSIIIGALGGFIKNRIDTHHWNTQMNEANHNSSNSDN